MGDPLLDGVAPVDVRLLSCSSVSMNCYLSESPLCGALQLAENLSRAPCCLEETHLSVLRSYLGMQESVFMCSI